MADQPQDQLLQDASTLLMFANVAAKQSHDRHSPSPPVQQFPPINQLGSQPNTKSPVSQSPTVSQSPPQLGQPQFRNQYAGPVQHPGAVQYGSSNQFPGSASVPNNNQLPQYGPGYPLATGFNYHPPLLPHVQFHQNPVHQNAVHQNPEQQLPFSNSSPGSNNNSKHSSVSEPNPYPRPHLPHRRTSSVGNITGTPTTAVPTSPGAFQRGIDNETGRRNDNNAKFAAAALAQAADYPLRPVKREDGGNELEKDEEKDGKDKDGDEKDEKFHKKPNTVPLPVKKPVRDLSFKAPPLNEYQVDQDAGVIGCICSIEDDDGLTVQCDKCYRWQHCKCMGFDTDEDVPDQYTCYYCDEQKWGLFDPNACRSNTLARLEEELNDAPTESDKKKRKLSVKAEERKRKRENSGANTPIGDKNKRKQLRDDFEPVFEMIAVDNKKNELLEEGISAENYQATYYKLRSNDYRNHKVQGEFEKLGEEFYRTVDSEKNGEISIMTLKEFKSIAKIRINLPNHQRTLEKKLTGEKPQYDDISIQVKPYSDTQKQKFNGISKLALFIQNEAEKDVVIPKGTAILEYFGVLDYFTNYRDNKLNQYHIWGTTKPKVLKTSLNLSPKEPPLEVILDSRFVGNETRFIRKSCGNSANVGIKKYYIPELKSFRFLVVTTKDITLNSDMSEEELRLPWEWDNSHPILKFNNESFKIDHLEEKEKNMLINTIDTILYFTECGCNTTSNTPQYLKSCSVFKVKKAITYMLRATRKISGITSVHASRPRELVATEPRKYISWETRLDSRERDLESKLFDGDSESEPEEIVGVPFKRKVMNWDQELGKAGDKKVEDGTENDENESDDEFPIIEELKTKIQKSIEKEIKVAPEIQKSISEIKSKLESSNSTPDLKKLEKIIESEIIEKPEIVNKQVEEVKKPPVKKKLSFADYKKKSLSK